MDYYTYFKNKDAAARGAKTPVRKSTFPKWSELSKDTRDQLESALKAADEVLNRPEVKKKLAENRAKTQAWLREEVAKEARENRESNPAYQTLIAQADAANREAKEWDRRASEKMEAVKRAPRELVTYYNEQAREYRAHAELSRERAASFRRAAAAL